MASPLCCCFSFSLSSLSCFVLCTSVNNSLPQINNTPNDHPIDWPLDVFACNTVDGLNSLFVLLRFLHLLALYYCFAILRLYHHLAGNKLLMLVGAGKQQQKLLQGLYSRAGPPQTTSNSPLLRSFGYQPAESEPPYRAPTASVAR